MTGHTGGVSCLRYGLFSTSAEPALYLRLYMKRFLLIPVLAMLMLNCQNTSTETNKKDSFSTTSKIPEPKTKFEDLPPDTALTAFAKFISGMSSEVVFTPSTSESWRNYAKGNDENWKVLENRVGSKIATWVGTDLKSNANDPKTLFYPFAGGDLYYPSLFFPNQDTIIMIGLEPCGTLFDPNAQPADTLAKYYRALQHSMFFPHKLGFFRTLSMKDDFNNHLLNGTIHTLLFYLSRFGNEIQYIEFFNLDADGNPVNSAKGLDAKKRFGGYRVGYQKANGPVKEVIYFSQDASDGGMKAKPGLLKYLEKRGTVFTYFKAASYLMHYSTFSVVRNYVLGHSKAILQDDSGVPLKKLIEGGFEVNLFGNFTHTIPLFKAEFQPDLKEAYEKGSPKPVPFMIGYTAPDAECNLQWAVKK